MMCPCWSRLSWRRSGECSVKLSPCLTAKCLAIASAVSKAPIRCRAGVTDIVTFLCTHPHYRYHDLRRRNALEMEGYQTEAKQLRARLQQLDKAYNVHLLNRPRSGTTTGKA